MSWISKLALLFLSSEGWFPAPSGLRKATSAPFTGIASDERVWTGFLTTQSIRSLSGYFVYNKPTFDNLTLFDHGTARGLVLRSHSLRLPDQILSLSKYILSFPLFLPASNDPASHPNEALPVRGEPICKADIVLPISAIKDAPPSGSIVGDKFLTGAMIGDPDPGGPGL